MKIEVDESPMGSGKTHRATNEAVSTPSKTLFITERIDRFEELDRDIKLAAAERGTNPLVIRIQSKPHDRGNSVSREIERLPYDYLLHRHVIVLATHSAMLRSDFSGFQGWQIIVDEVPQFLDFEEKHTHLDSHFFEQHYELQTACEGWSVVKLREDTPSITPATVRGCESHEHLAVFHRRVEEASRPAASRYVLCNLSCWDEMADAKVTWCWASAFSLWELQAFDRIVLLGNRFRRDIGSVLSERLSDAPVEWIALPEIRRDKAFVHRSVRINYFSDRRQASRSLFESSEGEEMLSKIGDYLARALPHGQSIWSANATAAKLGGKPPRIALQTGGLSPDSWLPPRQAGTNLHSRVSHAAMIYSAKASANLRGLLQLLGISHELWTKSVEHEAICQFMTRTSVRDPDNASPVHFWVFDQAQARYLKEYFDGLDHVSASIAHVADGPAIPAIAKSGPKVAHRTPEQQVEFQNAKRRKDAERKRKDRAMKRHLKAKEASETELEKPRSKAA